MSERSDEREELAKALCEAYCRADDSGASWAVLGDSGRAGYLAEADVAIARCARVPAEVWDVIDHMRETPIGRAFAESLEAALKAAKRHAEPSLRITREHYDAAYQRAVDASVRGEATVKDALYRELGVGEPAPRVLPTRDQLSAEVVSLLQRHGASSGLFPHAVVDRLTALLREHASPADDGVLRAQLRSAKAASDELEAMLATAERERDSLAAECKTAQAQRTQAERERDALRQELAEVTGQAEQVEGDLALLRRERDEARESLRIARLERDELREAVAKLELVVKENMRKADDHRRQRDKLVADISDLFSLNTGDAPLLVLELRKWRTEYQRQGDVLAKRAAELAAAHNAAEHAGYRITSSKPFPEFVAGMASDLKSLEAQLAARPEPVVIDEALAERFLRALRSDGIGTDHGRVIVDNASVRRALRSVLGERVSVAGPRADAMDSVTDGCIDALADERDKLRAELQATQEKLESTRTTLGTALQAEARNVVALRGELQAAQAELAKRAKVTPEEWSHLCTQEGHLQNDYRELRAAADKVHQEMYYLGDQIYQHVSQFPGERMRQTIEELRALLKPATREAQEWVNASHADARRPNDRHAQRPLSELHSETAALIQRVAGENPIGKLREQADRTEAALRCFLRSQPVRGTYDAAALALAMLDAGKQEGGK